jgi:glycosyltransferase involved in cell wall biosynthesis
MASKTPRIALIEPVGSHGGMDYYDTGFCVGLQHHGVPVVWFTCDKSSVVGGHPVDLRRTFHGIWGKDPGWKRGLRYVGGLWRSLAAARREKLNTAHFHFFHVGPLEVLGVVAARAFGLKAVATVHDVEAFQASGKSPWMQRLAYALCERLVVHNRVSRDELASRTGIASDRISIVPHGSYLGYVQPALEKQTARAALGLGGSDEKVILFFGQIKEVKGLDLLLKAFAKARADMGKVRLVIAGKVWKDDFSRYQALIDRHALADRVSLVIRYIADEEVAAFYGAADLVALPYRRIYQSGVLLMAMSLGVPVLASDLPGMTEIVTDGENGFLFKTGDADDLARRLALVMHDDAGRARCAQHALADMRARFDWTVIGGQLLRVYSAVPLTPVQHAVACTCTDDPTTRKLMKNSLRILGIRGVPAAHGGFETFAEHLALYLVARDWDVTVYCQEDGEGEMFTDEWRGVKRIRIPVKQSGPKGTIVFDWLATRHASRTGEPCLTLGYNTAVFCGLLRAKGVPNLINMDGIEWARAKWGPVAKLWFWMNDWMGCWLGNHLVADHPHILRHLATRVSERKITMIPYGADRVPHADAALLQPYGVSPGEYAILIARAEPENSILEVVRAWSRKPMGKKLLVLGKYEASHAYQAAVRAAASPEVLFPGAVYDKQVVQALRFHAAFYVHGHQVGGTNPSLVEALGAGSAVLAHDNAFNRWVTGDAGVYFSDVDSCAAAIEKLFADPVVLAQLRAAALQRHAEEFTWDKVLASYEALMLKCFAQRKAALAAVQR